MKGKSVILIEKERQFGSGVSSRNSEVIHAGVYYRKGSLKGRLCLRGKELLYEFCTKYSVNHNRIGKLFVAISEEDITKLEKINNSALDNGLFDLIYLDSRQIKKLEPSVKAKSALFSPSSGIMDSHGFMQSLMKLNYSNGTTFAAFCPVIDAEPSSIGWSIRVGGQEPTTVTSRAVINSSGLYAIELSSQIFPNRIIPTANPVKGAYLRYSGKSPLKKIIYPAIIPGLEEERVDATPDLSESLRFGPSVEGLAGNEDYSMPNNLINRFTPEIKKYLPNIDESKLHFDQVGIRPKIIFPGINQQDFIFDWAEEAGWLDLWGIDSPGLTASLAIGEYVYSMFNELKILQ